MMTMLDLLAQPHGSGYNIRIVFQMLKYFAKKIKHKFKLKNNSRTH